MDRNEELWSLGPSSLYIAVVPIGPPFSDTAVLIAWALSVDPTNAVRRRSPMLTAVYYLSPSFRRPTTPNDSPGRSPDSSRPHPEL